VAATIAATGVIFAAAYMLPMVQRVLYGPVDDDANRGLADIGLRERIVLIPALLMIILIGVYPGPFLTRTAPSVNALIEQVEVRASKAPIEAQGEDVRFDHLLILGVDGD